MTEPNVFSTRIDNAATQIKGRLSQQLSQRLGREVNLPERKVNVEDQGGSPKPPPGSYAAMQQEAEAEREVEAQEATQQEPAPQEPEAEISEKANSRIRGLVAQLREKDQALQALQSQYSSTASTVDELKGKHGALEASYKKLIEQNLDNLDPDTRIAVMQDARLMEAIAASEQRILSFLTPQLEAIKERDAQEELSRVASKYAGFDYEIHPYLIQECRKRNPALSIEMAFKAVADPETLAAGAHSAQRAVPQVIPPGSGPAQPRNVPAPEKKSDPEVEIQEEVARASSLMRSKDPNDHRSGRKMFGQNIARRLGL